MIKKDWYKLEIESVFEKLNTSESGLNDKEVNEFQMKYGKNELPKAKVPTLIYTFLLQFLHPLIYILLGATIASLLIGEYTDAAIILAIVLLNSSLGGWQEWKAGKNAANLQDLIKVKVRALRNNKDIEIDSTELVPGDIVFIETGLKVSADIRIIESNNLRIDESFLTGESIASEKDARLINKESAVSEIKNMCFAGSFVLYGRGKGVVVATGLNTEVGNIAKNVNLTDAAKAPLVIRMEKFTKQISNIILGFSLLLGGYLFLQNYEMQEIFFFVVALAVSAIPEGLPVALTVALSIATSRMAKRNVIVRKLNAVESLGSCTIIASDKTGTLTVNQQTVRKINFVNGAEFSVDGEGYNGEGNVYYDNEISKTDESNDLLKEIVKVSIFANEAKLEKNGKNWESHGDAMDIALLAMAQKTIFDLSSLFEEYSLKNLIPYESEKKYSGAILDKNNNYFICVKGAVETVLSFCNLDENVSNKIEKQADKLAADGYRVLGFAKKISKEETIENLDFLGLIAFIDPLRSEVIDSVQKCKDAGIKVIMITGDHPETAKSISKELGILSEDEQLATGAMLNKASEESQDKFDDIVNKATVFARVSPIQKMHIVESMKRRGEFVAVTGDGVNDAPAMRTANIGVAMGSGTDVAKETGSMIVKDDNFTSIVAGVEEGRFAYDNVRKVILLLVSTGTGVVVLIMFGLMFGLPLPLIAVQLLWLNLVTNGIQDVGLAFEKGEDGAMKRMPRDPKEKVFNKLMVQQALTAGFTMGSIGLIVWFYLLNYTNYEIESARNILLLLIVFMQNFQVFNSRSETISAFKVPISKNYILIFGVLLASGVHFISMYLPFMQKALKVEPISITEIITVFFIASSILFTMEIFKKIKTKFKKL